MLPIVTRIRLTSWYLYNISSMLHVVISVAFIERTHAPQNLHELVGARMRRVKVSDWMHTIRSPFFT